MVKAIDAITVLYTPDAVKYWYPTVFGKAYPDGFPIEKYIEHMDDAGVEKCLLAANRGEGPPKWKVPYELVKKYVDKYPDRFAGLAGVDPLAGMEGVRELEKGIREYGFVSAHVYPHWFKKPPNDPIYYPIYAKCVELNVPIEMQIAGSAQWYLPSVGHPLCLEDVFMHFPELKIIALHMGWPWTEELIFMVCKCPNLYVTTSWRLPLTKWDNPMSGFKMYPSFGQEWIDFIKSPLGQDKVLFGTNFPIANQKVVLEELEQVGITGEVKKKVIRDNALKVFRL